MCLQPKYIHYTHYTLPFTFELSALYFIPTTHIRFDANLFSNNQFSLCASACVRLAFQRFIIDTVVVKSMAMMHATDAAKPQCREQSSRFELVSIQIT